MARRKSKFKTVRAKPTFDPTVQSSEKSSRREIAEALKQASANLFLRYGFSCTYELGVESWGKYRADVCGCNLKGQIVIVETKSSVSDFRTDQKLGMYLAHCDRFYVAFTRKVWNKIRVKPELTSSLPKGVGVIVLEDDGYAYIKKPCRLEQMSPESRLKILARLAWRNGELSKRVKRARVRVYVNE